MKLKTIHILPIFLIVILSGCTAPNGGRWPAQGSVSPSSANPSANILQTETMALNVSTAQSDYLLGEPVYISLTLKNTDQRIQKVVGSLDPIDGAISIRISNKSTSDQVFVPLLVTDNDIGIFNDLEPQAMIGSIVPIFFGTSGWTFKNVGEYDIMAVYHTPDTEGNILEVRSQALSININPSTIGEKLIVGDVAEAAETGRFLTWQSGDHLEKGISRLERLIKENPDSVLASYIYAAFAHSFGEPFANYIKGEVRPLNCDLALEYLGLVNEELITEYIRLKNSIVLTHCMLLNNNWEAAETSLNYTREVAGGRPEYADILSRASNFEKYLLEEIGNQ